MLIKQTLAALVKAAAERAFPITLSPKVEQAPWVREADYVTNAPKELFKAHKKNYDKSEVCFGYFNSREVADCIFVQLARHPMLKRTVIGGDGSLEFEICGDWIEKELLRRDSVLAAKALVEFPELQWKRELVDERQLMMGKFVESIASGEGQEVKLVYVPVDSGRPEGFRVGRVFNHLGYPTPLDVSENVAKLQRVAMHCHTLSTSFQMTPSKCSAAQDYLDFLGSAFQAFDQPSRLTYTSYHEDHRRLGLELVRYYDALDDCLRSGSSYPLAKYLSTLSRLVLSMKSTLFKESSLAGKSIISSSLKHLDTTLL